MVCFVARRSLWESFIKVDYHLRLSKGRRPDIHGFTASWATTDGYKWVDTQYHQKISRKLKKYVTTLRSLLCCTPTGMFFYRLHPFFKGLYGKLRFMTFLKMFYRFLILKIKRKSFVSDFTNIRNKYFRDIC